MTHDSTQFLSLKKPSPLRHLMWYPRVLHHSHRIRHSRLHGQHVMTGVLSMVVYGRPHRPPRPHRVDRRHGRRVRVLVQVRVVGLANREGGRGRRVDPARGVLRLGYEQLRAGLSAFRHRVATAGARPALGFGDDLGGPAEARVLGRFGGFHRDSRAFRRGVVVVRGRAYHGLRVLSGGVLGVHFPVHRRGQEVRADVLWRNARHCSQKLGAGSV